MEIMPTELEYWRSQVKDFPTSRLEIEAKNMAFIKNKMINIMPFPCPYLEALNEELKERYKVGNNS